jgi:glycosyltransferase involved in cell wall biosynthesis
MQEFIGDAIISCLNQTYQKIEVIVIDDGSEDDTKHIVSEFGKPVYYYYKKNAGVSAARNFGINQAKGQYISFLDADDIWFPSKLEKQIEAIKSNNSIKAISCGYSIMDDNGRVTMQGLIRGNYKNRRLQHRDLSICQLVPGSASGLLAESCCIKRAGKFDEMLFIAEDWDMWLRITEFEQIYYIEDILVIIRTRKKKDPIRSLENERKQVEKCIIKNLSNTFKKKAFAALYARVGSQYLTANNFDQAIKYLLMSICNWPSAIFPVDIKNRFRYPKRPRYYLLAKAVLRKYYCNA